MASANFDFISPGYSADQQSIDLARQLALSRVQQGQTLPQGQMVGGIYVAPSITQYLAQGLQGLSGLRGLDLAKQQQSDLSKRLGENLGNMFSGRSDNPATQPENPQTQWGNGTDTGGNAANTAAPGTLAIPGMSKSQATAAYMLSPDHYMSGFMDQFKPTDLQKNDRYLGVQAPQSAQLELAKRLKEGALSLQPGQTNLMPNGQTIVAPDFNAGVAGGFTPQGAPFVSSIPGASQAAADKAGAVKNAETDVVNKGTLTTVETPEGPRLMTNKQAIELSNGGAQNQAPAPMRNKNPGAMMSGGTLARYPTLEAGLQATDGNLQSYAKQGVSTLGGVISKWAPAKDAKGNVINDTASYIKDAATRLGISPDQKIDLSNPVVRHAVATAIMLHENGPAAIFGQNPAAAGNSTPGISLASATKKKYDEATGANMAEYEKMLNQSVESQAGLVMRLQQSADALTKFRAGGGAETRMQVAQAATALGLPQNVVNGIAGGDLASMQVFQKNAAVQAMETLRQTVGQGSRLTNMEFDAFRKSNPNLVMQPDAIKKIYDLSNRLYKLSTSEQSAFRGYVHSGNDIADFPAYWTKKAKDLGLLNVSSDTPTKPAYSPQQVADELRRRGLIK